MKSFSYLAPVPPHLYVLFRVTQAMHVFLCVVFQRWRLPWNSLPSVVPSRSPWTGNSTTDAFRDSLVFSDVSFKIESGFPAQNRLVIHCIPHLPNFSRSIALIYISKRSGSWNDYTFKQLDQGLLQLFAQLLGTICQSNFRIQPTVTQFPTFKMKLKTYFFMQMLTR